MTIAASPLVAEKPRACVSGRQGRVRERSSQPIRRSASTRSPARSTSAPPRGPRAMSRLNSSARGSNPGRTVPAIRSSLPSPALSCSARAGVDRRADLFDPGRRFDAGEDPSCAGGLPRPGFRAGFDLDHQVEWFVLIGAELANLLGKHCEIVGPGQIDREVAVPVRGPLQGTALRPTAGDPDRDARPLDRGGLELAGPELGELGQALIEEAGALARVDDLAEGLELAVAIAAETDSEGEATAAQVVERHGLASDLLDAPPRKGRDHRTDPEPLGRARDGRERDPDIGNGLDGRAVVDVVPEKVAVPAALLGSAGELRDGRRLDELVEGSDEDPTVHAHARTLSERLKPSR